MEKIVHFKHERKKSLYIDLELVFFFGVFSNIWGQNGSQSEFSNLTYKGFCQSKILIRIPNIDTFGCLSLTRIHRRSLSAMIFTNFNFWLNSKLKTTVKLGELNFCVLFILHKFLALIEPNWTFAEWKEIFPPLVYIFTEKSFIFGHALHYYWISSLLLSFACGRFNPKNSFIYMKFSFRPSTFGNSFLLFY